MIRQLLPMWFAASAYATSVVPELHECPVCGMKSVRMALCSYSQFGEPARDLSDSPVFRFADVNLCPGDLYASWSDRWKNVDAGEKAKLAAFLKEPSLRLTDAEKTAIRGHEKEFRDSNWFAPLWVRTCDELRRADERRRFDDALQLHFAGPFGASGDWEKTLVSHYRENAIAALKDALAAKWPNPGEKRVFAYLRAELTRQAGRDAEAFVLFQEVIAAEKTAKPDEDLAWIPQWAAEQSLRCGPEAKDPASLLDAIIPELPDPWRKQGASDDPRWPRHYAAVDVLAQRAASGDKPFADALWNLLERKPERLLALLETTGSDIAPLRSVDPRWSGWFDELASRLAARKLPAVLAKDPNDTRVANVLRRAVGGDEGGDKAWRNDKLLPAVRKAAAGGGMPAIKMPEDHSGFDLPPIDGESDEPPKPSLKEFDRELYKLWEEQAPPVRPDIARIYIRFLRQANEDWDSTQYPAMYFLPAIAETEDGRAAIRKELDGKWKSSFWKAACAYAARMPDSGKAFIRHPFIGKADDSLVVKLLTQQSDASWKDAALRKLKEDEWVSSEVIQYLGSLDLPETNTALEQTATGIRNAKNSRRSPGMDGKLSTLRQIDEIRIRKRLEKLPIR